MVCLKVVKASGLSPVFLEQILNKKSLAEKYQQGGMTNDHEIKPLLTPLIKYKDYLLESCPDNAKKILSNAKPGKIATIDALVDKYNADKIYSADLRLTPEFHAAFYGLFQDIIYSESRTLPA
jgi:hypothetical protein